MQAEVKWLKVWFEAPLISENPFPSLRGPTGVDIIREKEECRPQVFRYLGIMPILTHSENLDDYDMYVGSKLLRQVEEKEKRTYGLYGPSRKVGLATGYMIAPVDEAVDAGFLIYDWGVVYDG